MNCNANKCYQCTINKHINYENYMKKGKRKKEKKRKKERKKMKDDVLNSKHPPPPLPLNYHFLPSILFPLPTHKCKYIKKKTT